LRFNKCSTDSQRVEGEADVSQTIASRSIRNRLARWVLVAHVLSIPALVTGGGAVLLWVGILLDRFDVKLAALPDPLGAVFVAGFFTAGHGAFYAPPFLVAAILVASIGSARAREATDSTRNVRLVILVGVLGILMAWAGLPSLL
jgi:hypothetical protein